MPAAIIDVHRDAAANLSFVREISGVQAAQVMVVVSKLGATKASLHPHWQENMRFATQMEAVMRQLYPGMLRHYPPVGARYNQQLHPNMVLLEIGNYLDGESYALRSAAMMADVLALMIDAAKQAPARTTTQPATTSMAKPDQSATANTAKSPPPTPKVKPPTESAVSSPPSKALTPPVGNRPLPKNSRP
jgi:histidinol dehydrogenase